MTKSNSKTWSKLFTSYKIIFPTGWSPAAVTIKNTKQVNSTFFILCHKYPTIRSLSTILKTTSQFPMPHFENCFDYANTKFRELVFTQLCSTFEVYYLQLKLDGVSPRQVATVYTHTYISGTIFADAMEQVNWEMDFDNNLASCFPTMININTRSWVVLLKRSSGNNPFLKLCQTSRASESSPRKNNMQYTPPNVTTLGLSHFDIE